MEDVTNGKTILKWNKFRNLVKESVDYYKKVFGEYHPRVSYHMARMCMLFFKYKDQNWNFKRDFSLDTKKLLEITHGTDHYIYVHLQLQNFD